MLCLHLSAWLWRIKQNVPWTGKSCLQCPRSRQRTVLGPSLCLTLWPHRPSSLWRVGGNCHVLRGKVELFLLQSENRGLPSWHHTKCEIPGALVLCVDCLETAWYALAMWSASVKRATYLFHQMQPCQKASFRSEIQGEKEALAVWAQSKERRVPIYLDSHKKWAHNEGINVNWDVNCLKNYLISSTYIFHL